MSKTLCWFSNGAASAVAAKFAVENIKDSEVIPICCDTRRDEHPDNYRFSQDVERWLGRKIVFIKSDLYDGVDSVFEKVRYMSGVRGARCTTELKKIPRIHYAAPDDVHVFGFTVNEGRRISEFKKYNPDLLLRFVLQEARISKDDCYKVLNDAGIELPAMYKLGFRNNNCIGCVKASSPWYWSMIRKHFPDVFARRAAQSRAIGCRLVEIKHHDRIFLDELPDREFKQRGKKENISCGPECGGHRI